MEQSTQSPTDEAAPRSDPTIAGLGPIEKKLSHLTDSNDPLNLFRALKDVKYGVPIATSALTSLLVGAFKVAEKVPDSTGKMVENPRFRYVHMGTSLANSLFVMGISWLTSSSDIRRSVKIFNSVVREEFAREGHPIKGEVTVEHLLKSKNPIVQISAQYYEKKRNMIYASDVPGLVTSVLAPQHGVNATMLAKSGFFGWYFMNRKAGSHYAAMDIWNKSEGAKNPKNWAINRGPNPGEEVTANDIIGLYEHFQIEREKPDGFSLRDSISFQLFQQTARYLNHEYLSEFLQKDYGPDVKHSNLRFSEFIEFVGNDGININEPLKGAVLLEVIAKKGVKEFFLAKEELEKIKKYAPPGTAEEFKEYQQKLYRVAEHYLNDDPQKQLWPPQYVRKMEATYARKMGVESLNLEKDQAQDVPVVITPDQPHVQMGAAEKLAGETRDTVIGYMENDALQKTSVPLSEEKRNQLDQQAYERTEDGAYILPKRTAKALMDSVQRDAPSPGGHHLSA